jgi:hypothetical protein
MSISIGQTLAHLPHMVQIQGHRADTAASSAPKVIILTSFLGSNPSIPEAGHEDAQIPQVRQ